jgi:predicted lysophospholipase L1 biosynthesis ABC-type transport system permease subunit
MDRDPTLDGPEIYHPYTTAPTPMLSLRCVPVCDPAAVRHRLASTHPAVGARNVRLAADHYGRELARPRASAALATAFAAIAVTASAGGLLSVLSYAVNRRRREFGIRMALGASSREIRRVVLRDGLFVAVAGLGIGSLLAAALVGMLASLQYGVTSADPVSWSIVFGVIVLTAVAASWGPARAASRIDPLVLLREE